MELSKFLEIIEKELPTASAMEGDKVGLQVQVNNNVNSILVTLDLTDDVISESISHGIDTIVAFHPLIYRPLAEINQDERVGRLTTKLIQNNINLITVHTAFDAHANGTNKILADKLELEIEQHIVPDDKFSDKGMGVLGIYNESIPFTNFLERCSKVFKSPLKYCTGKKDNVSKVAIVGGSGSSFLRDVERLNPDVFVTADLTYHIFHAYKGKIALVDPGHYEMEQYVIEGISNLLKPHFNGEKIIKTRTLTNPVNFYPDNEKFRKLQFEFIN